MKASVKLSMPINARTELSRKATEELPRVDLEGTTREDIIGQVMLSVRLSFSAAIGSLMHKLPESAQSTLVPGISTFFETVPHLAHIEWDNGESEAVTVPLSIQSIAEASCAYMVYMAFSEGVIEHG